MQDKILSLLGLAKKAGKLKAGYDVCTDAIRSGQAVSAFACMDISEKTFKNLLFEAEKAGIPALRLSASTDMLSYACKIHAGTAVLTDSGFSKAIIDKINETSGETAK